MGETTESSMKKLIVLALFAIQLSAVHAAQGLNEIFELALANDPRYQQARANRDSALETRPQAIARLLPLVSAQAATGWNYLFNKKRTFQGKGTQKWWAHTASVGLTQSVFNWQFGYSSASRTTRSLNPRPIMPMHCRI